MPAADFFKRFGLFVVRDFFDAETCTRLRREVDSAPGSPATIWQAGETYVVDKDVRRTTWREVNQATRAFVELRLMALKPALERHFQVDLVGCRKPNFLVYREGDFYLRHRDSNTEPGASSVSRERKLSAIVFLNGEAEAPGPDTFGGGELTFYDLIADPRLQGRGWPLASEAGVLIAFPSHLLHEVKPVSHGLRYTIASWFY